MLLQVLLEVINKCKTKNRMKQYLLIVLLSTFSITSFGQKLKSDGITVEMTKYEVTEQDVPMFGKQKMILGTFQVKEGKKKVATHNFIIPIIKGEISHIAVLGSDGQKIFPRLHYVNEEKAFTYHEGTEKEGKEVAKKSGSQKNIVLSGLLIWARLTYNQ